MNQEAKTFCCRFELAGGYMTSKLITSKEIDKGDAMQWAIKEMRKHPELLAVNSVYEISTDA